MVREPLAVEAEPGIEAGAEVLERDPGGELDELRIAEERPDARGQLVRDRSRAGGCRFGVLEDRPLALVEEIARAPAADRSHLGRIDALVHPFVVAVVDAPGAADLHAGRLHREPAHRGVELPPAVLDRCLQAAHGDQDPGVV